MEPSFFFAQRWFAGEYTIHDIYIVNRSNISVFHNISCAFVVWKTVDGIWPKVRQGAWRPSLQASKLGNFRNSLDERFETRAAKRDTF